MTRGVWLSALALGLGGWLGGAGAQQAVWRPATRPAAPAPTARSVSAAGNAALGRPVAGRPADRTPSPGAFPPAYRTALDVLPPASSEGVEQIPAVPPPGTVIAATANYVVAPPPPPAPRGEEDHGLWQRDLFAADRDASHAG